MALSRKESSNDHIVKIENKILLKKKKTFKYIMTIEEQSETNCNLYFLSNKSMRTENLNYTCCPGCKGILTYPYLSIQSGISADFFCEDCHIEYSDDKGYLDFLGDKEIVYRSKWDRIVRTLYAKFYSGLTNFILLFIGGPVKARNEVLSLLELKDNAVILETGMGPGDNFPFLIAKAKNLRIFAIDNQKQMMIRCMKNLRKWKIDAELFRADAEELPFRDEMFDTVFHIGAFNVFTNKDKALNEMIRVARSGAKIVIADESEKGYNFFNMFTWNNDKFILPVDLIPKSMLNTTVSYVWKGFGYVIAFTKP